VGARFSAPVQTGPGAHPASCTMGTGFFLGVKSSRGVRLTPHPFYCRGQERIGVYLYSPYGPYGLYRASVPVQGCTLPFTFIIDLITILSIYLLGNIHLSQTVSGIKLSQRKAIDPIP